jgi:hypothetical protein
MIAALLTGMWGLGLHTTTARAEEVPGAGTPEIFPMPRGLPGFPAAGGVANPCCCPEPELFTHQRMTLQTTVGYYSYFNSAMWPLNPTFDFLPISLRLGRVLNDPWDCLGPLRGNFELIGEFFTAPVTEGYGCFLMGPSVMLRYNFVQPDCRLIPYIQAAAGIVGTDAYRDRQQNAIGQQVEFLLQSQLGVHYLLSRNWSLDAEGGFIHVSNGGMAGRNAGLNSVGGSIGLTYYFDCLWK